MDIIQIWKKALPKVRYFCGQFIERYNIIAHSIYIQGENILIIGGNEESLSPLLLHVDDKEIEFDMCRNYAYKKQEMFYGAHLGEDLVICGGVDIKVSSFT